MDLLDRLHRRLSDAARQAHPDAFGRLYSIAEIYQQLIPYRAVREELGLLEFAMYEHALLRLLAGERGYAELAVPGVAEELRAELRAPNPILGVYRDYAAVEVRLQPAPDSPHLRAEPGAPPARTPVPAPPPPPRPEPGPAAPPAPAPVAPAPRPPPSMPVRAPAAPAAAPPRPAPLPPPAHCGRCAEALPLDPGVRFCPFCGTARGPVPCGGCGARLEPAWSYCTQCGRARRPGTGG